jgi:hypothetical protein
MLPEISPDTFKVKLLQESTDWLTPVKCHAVVKNAASNGVWLLKKDAPANEPVNEPESKIACKIEAEVADAVDTLNEPVKLNLPLIVPTTVVLL